MVSDPDASTPHAVPASGRNGQVRFVADHLCALARAYGGQAARRMSGTAVQKDGPHAVRGCPIRKTVHPAQTAYKMAPELRIETTASVAER